jgi:hypothetical protein
MEKRSKTVKKDLESGGFNILDYNVHMDGIRKTNEDNR